MKWPVSCPSSSQIQVPVLLQARNGSVNLHINWDAPAGLPFPLVHLHKLLKMKNPCAIKKNFKSTTISRNKTLIGCKFPALLNMRLDYIHNRAAHKGKGSKISFGLTLDVCMFEMTTSNIQFN